MVANTSSCQKAKTVTHGKRRIRIPGESAIAWNQEGPPGIPGQNGSNGANGINGINGINGAAKVVVRTTVLPPAPAAGNEADCNAGERAVGGGVARTDGSSVTGDRVGASFPVVSPNTPATAGTTPTGWKSDFTLEGGAASITFYVICASP